MKFDTKVLEIKEKWSFQLYFRKQKDVSRLKKQRPWTQTRSFLLGFCSYYPSEQKLSFTYNNGGLSLLVFYAFNIDLKEGQSPKEYKKREKKVPLSLFLQETILQDDNSAAAVEVGNLVSSMYYSSSAFWHHFRETSRQH